MDEDHQRTLKPLGPFPEERLCIIKNLHRKWEIYLQGREIYLWEGTPTKPKQHPQDPGHPISWTHTETKTGSLSFFLSYLFLILHLYPKPTAICLYIIGQGLRYHFPCQVYNLLLTKLRVFADALIFADSLILVILFDHGHLGILGVPFPTRLGHHNRQGQKCSLVIP